MTEYWYRAYGTVRWEERTFKDPKPHVTINCERLKVLRRTPKGVWLRVEQEFGTEKWVSNTARRRWAYPTKELALDSLLHRNRWRQIHLRKARKKAEAIGDALKSGEYDVWDGTGYYTAMEAFA